MNTNTDRIAWVDVFKFLGIWAIYIGHFGDKAGRAYPFVFTYHVPMFFFAAGFFSVRYLKDAPLVFLKKKTLQLMVPYVFFSAMALAVFTVLNNWDILQAKDAFMGFLFGIRDQIVAGSLWFIPCLYIIVVGDYFVRKLFKSQLLALAVSVVTFWVTQTLLPHNPASDPSWFMNLDSALYYYIYYALGAVMFPFLSKSPATNVQRAVVFTWTAVAFVFTLISFFLTPNWFFGKLALVFPALPSFKLAFPLFSIFVALAAIYCNIVIARLLGHISFLGALGRETLIFCGTEDVAKQLITQLLSMINLKVRLINPLVTIAFSLLCLVISKYTLADFLNTYFPWAVGKVKPNLSA